MAQELVTMSAKELKRLEVIRRVVENRWPQARAAALLGLTTRQVRRLCRTFEATGARGRIPHQDLERRHVRCAIHRL
jgi:transcriptional regulator with GAF, ATPase, and Fis domain